MDEMITALAAQAQEIERQRYREAELVALLKECADDLASEIEYRFDAVKRHPAMAAKYERDMEPVKKTRAALAKATATGKGRISSSPLTEIRHDMTDDLVQRLRSYTIYLDEYEPAEQIIREAANEIERLRNELEARKDSIMNKEALSQLIAKEVLAQGNEIDNLGDGESICLISNLPTINLVQLSEKILERLASK